MLKTSLAGAKSLARPTVRRIRRWRTAGLGTSVIERGAGPAAPTFVNEPAEPAELEPRSGRRRFAPVVAEVPVDRAGVPVWRATRLPSAGPVPWLDRPDAADAVDAREHAGEITADEAGLCRYWAENGYVIVPGLIDDATLDEAWLAYEQAIDEGAIVLNEPTVPEGSRLFGRHLDPHLHVPELARLQSDPRLVDIVELLLGAPPIPFQTITGHRASEQAVHSDSIHMTTYPQGYLVANWIAFEEIEADSGPLEYYPGSHRLPTVYADDAGIDADAMATSGYAQFDERYTPRIAELTAEHADQRRLFLARKGDVLFWHANLLHGGSAQANRLRSRHALVCHYFVEGCICYHDLSGSLSRVSI